MTSGRFGFTYLMQLNFLKMREYKWKVVVVLPVPLPAFWPRARSHLHSVGPCPFNAFFTVFLLAHVWELFPVGNQCDNTLSLKSLSSFGMWRNSIYYLGNNESVVNLNNYNFDWVLSHWFPTSKSSHACVGRKIGQWRRRGRGGVQLNDGVI